MRHERREISRWTYLPVGLLATMITSFVVAGCGDGDSKQQLAEEAYVFAFPMIDNYKTMYGQAIAPPNQEPLRFNSFQHNTQLIGPGFTGIVRPNNDTLYSIAWLDLRTEPMVIHVPAITDRYYSFQFVDMYTFNLGYIGTRTTGTGAANYMIAGPSAPWNGAPPDGIAAVFHSLSDYVYSLARTGVTGEPNQPCPYIASTTSSTQPADDNPEVDCVGALQAQYGLQPLSAFQGKPAPSPAPPDTFPVYDQTKATSVDFIGYFNWLLGRVTIQPGDQALIDSFRAIGVAPNLPFDAGSLDTDTQTKINRGVESAMEEIRDKAQHFGESREGWDLLGRVFGSPDQMNGQYLVRAAAAYYAIYGNDLEEAYYPSTTTDINGAPLDGSQHDYVLTFPAGQLPKVQEQLHGFWSVTMYSLPEQLLVANDFDRYSIGDRTSGLQYQDGQLEIYLQFAEPPPDKKPNWLPAPNGPFSLTLRVYVPDQSAIGDPLWGPPGIRSTN